MRQKDKVTGENIIHRMMTMFQLPAPRSELSYDTEKRIYYYRKGFIYNINIGVYGLRPVEVKVTLDGWLDGGEVIIGEDG